MRSFEFPIDPLLDALRSMFGRCFLILVCVAFGFGTGTAIVEKSLVALASGTLFFYGTAFVSVLAGYGALAFIVIFVFAILYVVFEWNERSLLVPFLVCTWVGMDTTDYILNRSPAARIEKKIKEGLRQSVEQKSKGD